MKIRARPNIWLSSANIWAEGETVLKDSMFFAVISVIVIRATFDETQANEGYHFCLKSKYFNAWKMVEVY